MTEHPAPDAERPAASPAPAGPAPAGRSSADPSPAAPSPGRAFAVYSLLRLGLLVVSFVVLRLLLGPTDELLLVGGAVLLSALLSVVLLRRQRDAFTEASMARAEQRRAARQSRRARLEEPGDPAA